MLPKISCIYIYILTTISFFYSKTSSANYSFQNTDENTLLSIKKKKTKKLCNKSFYLNDIEIILTTKGLLTISLTQTSKSSEEFLTHIAVEVLDNKERILTIYKTGKLELKSDETSKSYFFSENLNYQFSPEEFKIFIENAKRLRLGYKGCNEAVFKKKEKKTTRKLPEAVIVDNFNKKPSKKIEELSSSSYIVLSKLLHLRKFARAKGSDIIYTLKKGDILDVLEKRDHWWLIKYYSSSLDKRFIGFVHSDYLLPLQFSY